MERRRNVLRQARAASIVLPALFLVLGSTRGQRSFPLPQPAEGGTRGPSALLFRPDGQRLFVAEQDENLVAVLNPANGQVLAHWPTGGKEPDALALSPNGKALAVVNTFSGSLALLDIEGDKATLRKTVSLPGQPYGVVIAPDGRAFVSISDLNQVEVVDTTSGKVLSRIGVGYRPRALALTPNGKTLLCANLLGGGISVIDVASATERGRIAVPATNLRGLAISNDGTRAVVTAQQAHNDQPTVDPDKIWSNVVVCLRLNVERQALSVKAEDIPDSGDSTLGSVARVLVLDLPGRGAADPNGVALNARADAAYVALSGTHELAVVPLESGKDQAVSVKTEGATGSGVSTLDAQHATIQQVGAEVRRLAVGANPRALALRPQAANGDSSEVWVGNHLGNTLSVVSGEMLILPDDAAVNNIQTASLASNADAIQNPKSKIQNVRTVRLGAASFSPNRKLKGRFLFTSAHITRGGHFTCETCHPDGNTDGLSWKFAHVKGGVIERNTRDLRSAVLLTGPFGWDARDDDFEDFVNHEIVGLLHRRKMEHPEVHALWDLINETMLPPNPYRSPDGTLTVSARRGEKIFNGVGQCNSCHVGGEHGGTLKHAWIGTTPEGQQLDIPHLNAAYSTAPYLHDGSAATLEEIFAKRNPQQKHGAAHTLTTAQMKDVLEFVREL